MQNKYRKLNVVLKKFKRKKNDYKKYGLWLAIAGLLFYYATLIGWIPFSRYKVIGAVGAIGAGYESITSYLTGRMYTRRKIITVTSNPKSFWIQVILLAMLSFLGIVLVIFG